MLKKMGSFVAGGMLAIFLTGCFGGQTAPSGSGQPTEAAVQRGQADQTGGEAGDEAKQDGSQKDGEQTGAPSGVKADSSGGVSSKGGQAASDRQGSGAGESQKAGVGVGQAGIASGTDGSAAESDASSHSDGASAAMLTESQIKQKYKKKLQALEGYYSGSLNGLYGQAAADLKAGKMSKMQIYKKYAGAAVDQKEESQAQVNQVLAAMKGELQQNHYSIGSVDELRSAYYGELDKARGSALAQVKKALGM